MNKLNLKTIAERVSAPTPVFFKKIIKLAIVAGGIGVGILTAPKALLETTGIEFILPALLVTIGKGLALSGFIAGLIAKTTVETK